MSVGVGDGRSVLVTGANSGLGLATVLELARRQFRVVGTVRSKAKAELVTDAASRAGAAVETELLDVTDPEAAARVVDAVLVEPGGFRTGIWDRNETDLEAREGSRYEAPYRRTLAMTRLGQPVMGPPQWVARVVARALEARRPRARYLVGADAVVLAAADAVTPTRVKDRVIRLTLGL